MKKVIMVFLTLISIGIAVASYFYFFKKGLQTDQTVDAKQFDVFLVIDQSGSMKGDKMDPVPSDPEGIRVKAAHYFVDYLQYLSDPNSRNRVAVINFGTDTPAEHQVPLTELDKAQNIEQIKKKIEELSLGYTSFHKAFQKASEFFNRDRSVKGDRQPVIILFTDGEPKDPRNLRKEQYFNEIEEYVDRHFKNIKTEGAIRPTNFEFFVIALDAKGSYWHKDRTYWEKLAPARTFLLSKADEEELEKIFGKIAESLFSTQAGDWFDLETGTEKKLLIPPYIEKVVISVRKDRKVKEQGLEILKPDGKPLEPGSKLKISTGTGIKIYTVIEPDPGEWSLKISPSGKVRVKQDYLPTAFRLKKPQSIHPMGEPIQILTSFTKSDGTPVVPLSHYPFSFAVSVKTPDGTELKPKLVEEKGNQGLYRAAETIQTKQEGIYEITFEVNVGSFLKTGNFILMKNTAKIEVRPIVYFKSIVPSLERRYSIYHPVFFWRKNTFNLEGKLYREGKPIKPGEITKSDLNAILIAQAEKSKGWPVSTVDFLAFNESSGLFKGKLLPEKHIMPGPYVVTSKIELTQANGEQYIRSDENEFKAIFGYGIIGWAFLFVLIFYVSLQILWRIARAPLRGELFVGAASIGRPRDLVIYNKARVISKKQKLCIPWINTYRHEGDKNSSRICPTFYVIGDRHRMNDGRLEPAVTIFYRKFHTIPWWVKLYRGKANINIDGFNVRWVNN